MPQAARLRVFVSFLAFFGTAVCVVFSCKPRNFNSVKSVSPDGKEASWSSHPTSDLFRKHNPKNLSDASKVSQDFLKTVARPDLSDVDADSTAAEILSARHQRDLLKIINDQENERYLEHVVEMAKLTLDSSLETSLDVDAAVKAVFQCGVVDTDKGKWNVYKSLLKPPSDGKEDVAKSERLFNTVRGLSQERGGVVLGQVLAEAGFPGLWLLNPDARVSNEALRKHFADKPILANWLHEFPGVADALELHVNGVYSDAALKEILSISLFHNGPDAGYWNKVTSVFLPDEKFGAGKAAIHEIFSGTLYESLAKKLETGKPVAYPMPTTYLSLVHVVLDRLSQGTLGGVHKIWHEIKFFTPPPKMVEELLQVNQTGTLEQLAALKAHVESANMRSATPAPGKLLPAQVASLVALIEAAQSRVAALQTELRKSVAVLRRDEATNEPREATLRLSGGLKTVDASVEAPVVLGWIRTLLEKEQSSEGNGEPFRVVFREALKTLEAKNNPR